MGGRFLHDETQRIDIVYLWVDGADPVWRDKRRLALAQGTDGLARYGDVEGRYRDNGELRFNLRALEKFYPDHGHIYLVTDGQVPSWLRANVGLSIIDHRDLIPTKALPVFDSGNIESYLHHIRGLSERFIYLNDDVFFGASVDPASWFSADGLAVYRDGDAVVEHEVLQPDGSALVNASVLSKGWLSKKYPQYVHGPHIFAHSPRPMLKSLLFELELAAPEIFEQVRKTVFRSWQVPPIVPDLVPRWMVHTGRAALHAFEPRYISSGGADAEQQFADLVVAFGKIPFFCINDTCDDALNGAPPLQRINEILSKLLPERSSFERID